MKSLPIALFSSTLALSGCATSLPKVSAVHAGDGQLNCTEIPEEIARMDAIIEKADGATGIGRLVQGAVGVASPVAQGLLLEGMRDMPSAIMLHSGIELASEVAGMFNGTSGIKAQRTVANASERKAFLKQLYYTKCLR